MDDVSDPQPDAPGWHDDPDGRRRWWSGTHWGAYAPWAEPSEVAQPEARPERPTLDRSLTFDPTVGGRAKRANGGDDERPVRGTGPLPRPAAGGGAPGRPIAWEGAAAQPTGRPSKQMATAYVLLIALGLLGAHRYYLGRLGSGIVQMMLSFAAAAAVVVQTGDSAAPLWLLAVPAAAAIWWISDLFRTAAMVREHNRRAH
ncbi:TM2 domain-containing protein [Agrococcus baldri]|uniref:TM2 domain-containing protein n=1 Tax=Agrococcus baldri TaxID=153730 RepID=A0AA94KZC7_9MICO|nr:TM2 domain-containing protein [Agrococcus baldri]